MSVTMAMAYNIK